MPLKGIAEQRKNRTEFGLDHSPASPLFEGGHRSVLLPAAVVVVVVVACRPVVVVGALLVAFVVVLLALFGALLSRAMAAFLCPAAVVVVVVMVVVVPTGQRLITLLPLGVAFPNVHIVLLLFLVPVVRLHPWLIVSRVFAFAAVRSL